MIRFIFYFGALILLAGFASLITRIEGQLSFSLASYVIRMPTGIGFLLIAFLIVLVVILIFWVRWSLQASERRLIRQQYRLRRRGTRALTASFMALNLGDHSQASKQAQIAQRLLSDQILPLLIRAQIAEKAGDIVQAQTVYQTLLKNAQIGDATDAQSTSATQSAQAGLFRLALCADDNDAAHAIIETSLQQSPKAQWAHQGMFELAIREQNWERCLIALNALHRGSNTAIHNTNLGIVYLAMAQDAHRGDNPDRARKYIARAIKHIPDFVPAIALNAILAARNNNFAKARIILSRAWAKNPHPELIEAFMLCYRAQATQTRNAAMRQIIKNHSDHIESDILRAETAMTAQNWAGAKRALHRYNSELDSTRPPTRRIALMFDKIARGQNDQPTSHLWQARARLCPPEPGWYASDGTRLAHWMPICPQSNAFNAVTWKIPTATPILTARDATTEDEDTLILASPDTH